MMNWSFLNIFYGMEFYTQDLGRSPPGLWGYFEEITFLREEKLPFPLCVSFDGWLWPALTFLRRQVLFWRHMSMFPALVNHWRSSKVQCTSNTTSPAPSGNGSEGFNGNKKKKKKRKSSDICRGRATLFKRRLLSCGVCYIPSWPRRRPHLECAALKSLCCWAARLNSRSGNKVGIIHVEASHSRCTRHALLIIGPLIDIISDLSRFFPTLF